MADKQDNSSGEVSTGLGFLVAIVSAFAGYAQGGWEYAAIAAVLGFGTVKLVFFTFGVLVRFVVLGVILLIAVAILKNRYDFFVPFFGG